MTKLTLSRHAKVVFSTLLLQINNKYHICLHVWSLIVQYPSSWTLQCVCVCVEEICIYFSVSHWLEGTQHSTWYTLWLCSRAIWNEYVRHPISVRCRGCSSPISIMNGFVAAAGEEIGECVTGGAGRFLSEAHLRLGIMGIWFYFWFFFWVCVSVLERERQTDRPRPEQLIVCVFHMYSRLP